MTRPSRRRAALIAAVAVLVAAAAVVLTFGHRIPGLSGGGSDPDAGEARPHPRPAWAFYRPPRPLPSRPPGTLIRVEPVAAPTGVRGWRVLYHSRDQAGGDIAVSGTVFVPRRPAPAGGYPVVAWAHGTTGSGDGCAPSTDPRPLGGIEDGAALLADGDAVVATDYQGLGTPGPHPYLIGASEAHTVLDAVRAAIGLPGSGIGRDVVVFGHSEGGQAALFTGLLAARYAPELRLLGVAAASPPTDLPALARHLDRLDYGTAYLVEIAAGYAATDPSARLAAIMTPRGARDLPLVESACTDRLVAAYTGLPARDVFTRDPRTTPPWSAALAADSATALPAGLPVLVVQGDRDPIVTEPVTTAAVSRLRAAGATVDYRRYPRAAHNVVPAAARDVNTWIADRFRHRAA
jgi:acetyl esterase/lipase